MKEALRDVEAVFFVTPAQHLRTTMEQALPHLEGTGLPIVLCSKGIEISTGCLMSQIAESVLPHNPYVVLSGPTFARDVAQGLPAAVTLATDHNTTYGKGIAESISSKAFRPYVTDDPVGAEIGGAVKNVIAIACGIVKGAELGDSAHAAIMTRGMAEIRRMGAALGAKQSTLLGLSGMGDLALTCHSALSRNFSLGLEIGKGRELEDILSERDGITEGVYTAKAVLDFAKKHAVDMPICEAVNNTLHNGTNVKDTITALMSRPLTQENI